MSDRAWMGSKEGMGVYQAVIAAMSPHDTYIETHLGSGAVLARKPPAQRNIGIDRDPRALAVTRKRLAKMKPFSINFMDVEYELIEADCVAWLQKFPFWTAGRTLIYADPPYPLSTRSSDKRYRFDYTDADHKMLLYALSLVPAAVIISTYPNPLYADMLKGWRMIEFQAMTRGGPRTEQLYMNFPEGAVHWASFAGKDYIDRQRIKRKAERWKKNFAVMPPAERTAVLAALLEV